VGSTGGRLLSLMRSDIEQVLYEALPDTVGCRFDTSIDAVHSTSPVVHVTLSDGSQVTSDLLVGADGIHSQVRRLVFGPEEHFLRYLGYHTASFMFEDAQLAARIGNQFRMLSLPRRQVGLYAVGGPLLAAFFAHVSPSPARPTDPATELRRVYGDLNWHVPAVLAAAAHTADIYYDVVAQIDMPHWRMGRAVVIGDAGYAVLLLAGQGAALAVAGGYLLARAVGGQLDAELERFEAEFRPVVRAKQASGRRMVDFFVPPTEFHNRLRDAFLNAARLPALSRLLGMFFGPGLKTVITH
jgi:2-polyprenyl-6-methoxyphenol hydroxylase-like FAD-dependent oxidoreductase